MYLIGLPDIKSYPSGIAEAAQGLFFKEQRAPCVMYTLLDSSLLVKDVSSNYRPAIIFPYHTHSLVLVFQETRGPFFCQIILLILMCSIKIIPALVDFGLLSTFGCNLIAHAINTENSGHKLAGNIVHLG